MRWSAGDKVREMVLHEAAGVVIKGWSDIHRLVVRTEIDGQIWEHEFAEGAYEEFAKYWLELVRYYIAHEMER